MHSIWSSVRILKGLLSTWVYVCFIFTISPDVVISYFLVSSLAGAGTVRREWRPQGINSDRTAAEQARGARGILRPDV